MAWTRPRGFPGLLGWVPPAKLKSSPTKTKLMDRSGVGNHEGTARQTRGCLHLRVHQWSHAVPDGHTGRALHIGGTVFHTTTQGSNSTLSFSLGAGDSSSGGSGRGGGPWVRVERRRGASLSEKLQIFDGQNIYTGTITIS